MKLSFVLLPFLLCLNLWSQDYAPGYYTRTLAGSQLAGHVDAFGLLARFNLPTYQVADAGSNLYVWDAGNNRIRKITPLGMVSTLPGTANSVGQEMQMDTSGNIWSLTPTGLSETSTNGFTTFIPLNLGFQPFGFCIDTAGRFFTCTASQVIQFDAAGNQSVYAGSGDFAVVDGQGTGASFNGLSRICSDALGNLYVVDCASTLIRRIDTNQNVTTFAGVKDNAGPSVDGPVLTATFWNIISIAANSAGDVFVVIGGYPYNAYGTAVRRISSGQVQTLAGSFYDDLPFTTDRVFVNGAGADARFFGAFGLAPVGDRLFVTDFWNNCVREVSTNVLAPGGPATLVINNSDPHSLDVTADVGSVHEILISTDLTNWTAVDSLLITNLPSIWTDSNTAPSQLFYRTLLLQ